MEIMKNANLILARIPMINSVVFIMVCKFVLRVIFVYLGICFLKFEVFYNRCFGGQSSKSSKLRFKKVYLFIYYQSNKEKKISSFFELLHLFKHVMLSQGVTNNWLLNIHYTRLGVNNVKLKDC